MQPLEAAGEPRVSVEMGALPPRAREPLGEASAAAGGLDYSCHLCLLPWGAVLLVVGCSVTALGYAMQPHGSVLPSLGLVALGMSAAIFIASLAAWRFGVFRKARRRGSEGDLIPDARQGLRS